MSLTYTTQEEYPVSLGLGTDLGSLVIASVS